MQDGLRKLLRLLSRTILAIRRQKVLDEGFEDAVQFMMEPEIYHPNLRTTNSVELEPLIRRRDKVIGVYPNVASAERLVAPSSLI